MESLEPSQNLDQDIPDERLFEVSISLGSNGLFVSLLSNSLIQISVVHKFHDQTQAIRLFIKESFLVCNYTWVINGSQNADFVESVVLLFFRQLLESNLEMKELTCFKA